jgi:hypothetical protein
LERSTRFDRKARGERIERGVGLNLGGVNVQLASPDEPSVLTLLDHGVEETTKTSRP